MFSAAQFETNKEKKMVIFAIVIVMQSGIDIWREKKCRLNDLQVNQLWDHLHEEANRLS